MTDKGRSKAMGAYYTDARVAEFLVAWAVRSASDKVIDPSFGQGVFLKAACERLVSLGGEPQVQVHGVELDADEYGAALRGLRKDFGLSERTLLQGDFFELDQGSEPVDVVVGNPPFIRYQRFSGPVRQRALRRAASHGVRLSELTSAWAPFLVHAMSVVGAGGRLAMVVPFELSYATYARPVLRHLADTFGSVILLTFRQSLFPRLNEKTMLLLAEDKGEASTAFKWRDLESSEELARLSRGNGLVRIPRISALDHKKLCRAEMRLIEYLLPPKVRGLYSRLRELRQVTELGELADAGIGYVTGANDYFHFSPAKAQRWCIPQSFLTPAVRRGRALVGLRFTKRDWRQGLASEDTGYLLTMDDWAQMPHEVQRYLAEGERSGVPRAYKCRVRTPWYRVPHVLKPDAFLTYMSGASPKLVHNTAKVVAPNTLHVVRMRRGCGLNGLQLAALWQSSLTRLSTEIEGHALGGGMLKLEPGEAKNVLIPLIGEACGRDVVAELDALYRQAGARETRRVADDRFLRAGIGLSKQDCDLLQVGVETLLGRRYQKGKKQAHAV